MKVFNIDHGSAIPLHLQVEDLLRELIKNPEYQEGKLLPNEVALAKQLGISRNTVRQATNKLVFERLLVRKKGVGTTVAKDNITTKLDKWSSFTHEMGEKGVTFRNYEIEVAQVEADEEIRRLFNITRKSKVVKLERLRGLDTGPVVYFISYFHPRVGLTGKEDFTQPLYDMLERTYHTVASVSKEGISAILADKELSEKLEIAVGDPVLFRKRVVCDPGGRPIEYNLGFYRADKFTYTIEIERG
ncbi:GntR family transcriptional regulator [Rufibacter quisquiliarum]|uniref:GntR family transcriptional regulator n=1 Tax=Rufibacter quisquiliarum TaxID=1549639 RepID=A0A839GKG7_9BACT|nr:GntR family transcriptional regulator [Rufibacter quisquiliarum]MBA9077289.1 GntR family transcriptional regulator [Rufibacter quisquiliarum]